MSRKLAIINKGMYDVDVREVEVKDGPLKKVDGMYYQIGADDKEGGNIIPCVFVFEAEHKDKIVTAMKEMLREKKEMDARHYKLQVEMVSLFGAK